MITMKSMWRLSPDERRRDWFKRHHRLAERLLDAPVGPIAKLHLDAPHLDGFCAPQHSEQLLGWTEPWNHSAWVIRDWLKLFTTGAWAPPAVDDAVNGADCPLCFGPCRLQVDYTEGRPDPRLDRVAFVPWNVLTDAMALFRSEKDGVPWARQPDESLLDYTTRNFRVIKMVGYDNDEVPVAYTFRITDGVRIRYLVCTAPFTGSSRVVCEAVTERGMDALLFRIEDLGPAGPHELDGATLDHRFASTEPLALADE